MKYIIDAVRLIRNYPDQLEQLLKPYTKDQSLSARFMVGLLSGSITSDQQAAKLLYNSLPGSIQGAKYRVLKHRVWHSILNIGQRVELRSPEHSKVVIEEDRLRRNLVTLYRFVRSARTAALQKLLEESIDSAVALEFSEILAELYNIQYSVQIFTENDEVVQQTAALATHWYNAVGAEREAKRLFFSVALHYVHSASRLDKHLRLVSVVLARVSALCSKYRTIELNLRWYRTRILQAELRSDYRSAATISSEAVRFLQRSSQYTLSREAEFGIKSIDASLHLREAKKGIRLCELYQPVYEPLSRNWLIVRESHYLLYMLSGNYAGALNLVTESQQMLGESDN